MLSHSIIKKLACSHGCQICRDRNTAVVVEKHNLPVLASNVETLRHPHPMKTRRSWRQHATPILAVDRNIPCDLSKLTSCPSVDAAPQTDGG